MSFLLITYQTVWPLRIQNWVWFSAFTGTFIAGLLEREIGLSKGPHLHKTTQQKQKKIGVIFETTNPVSELCNPYVPWISILNSFLFIPLFHEAISATDVFFFLRRMKYNRKTRAGYGEKRTAYALVPTFTCKVWCEVQNSISVTCPRPRFLRTHAREKVLLR
jgi:hypothetical protein